MKPVREEEPWGMNGRTEFSRLAGELYLAGQNLLSEFIGVDEFLMEESARPGEWSGKQVLKHMVEGTSSSLADKTGLP